MDDVQAVHLGAAALAARLQAARPPAVRGLSRDAELLHDALLGTACLHIVHFFTRRSAFVARTLVQQSRSLDGLIGIIDAFIERHPSPRAADAAFERSYLAYLARKHGRLTVYGIDLAHSPDRWPLDAAYTSLEATAPAGCELPGISPFTEEGAPRSEPAAPVPAPADQALAGRDRVLLRGVAGSGKSTLVQWLAVSCTKAPARRPSPASTAGSPSSSRCAPSPGTARRCPPRGRWHGAARCAAEDPGRLDAYEQSLLAAVHTKQDLARLATNPLMCGLTCALHRDRRGYLPTGRKELYDAALGMLLSRRDRERDMAAPTGIELSDEPQIQLLQRLAYWLIRNGRTELDRERAERIIGEALPAVPAAAEPGGRFAEQPIRTDTPRRSSSIWTPM